MDYLHFSLLDEKDFDEIIINAGGKRYTNNPKIQEKNCDYILDDVVIELKIIEEEPIEKEEKQKKFIELFPAEAQTVILDPTEEQKNRYYKILETPIKSALKKASKQLQVSANKIDAKLRIAMIMNNGLYMVSQDEFLKIALQRTKNDTSGIDILIVCSMHYYSDKFEMYTLFEFKDYEINKVKYQNKKQIIDKLRNEWNKRCEQYLTDQMTKQDLNRKKEPIKDLYFESDGIRYIKPIIQWGKSSEFWINGRPREDTTKEYDVPQILIVPMFNEKSYEYVKDNIVDNKIMQKSLNDYIKWIKNNPLNSKNKIQLVIYIELNNQNFQNLNKPFQINDIQQCANLKHKSICRKIEDNMQEYSIDVDDKSYILVDIQEIGQDMANDITSISHITNNTRQEWLIDGQRIKYEYAIQLAISFCIILKADNVYYIRNEDFKWK